MGRRGEGGSVYAGRESLTSCLTLPDEEALARVLARNEREPGHLYVSANTYHVLKRHFEPLGADEVATIAS